jgi:hypothetical protein
VSLLPTTREQVSSTYSRPHTWMHRSGGTVQIDPYPSHLPHSRAASSSERARSRREGPSSSRSYSERQSQRSRSSRSRRDSFSLASAHSRQGSSRRAHRDTFRLERIPEQRAMISSLPRRSKDRLRVQPIAPPTTKYAVSPDSVGGQSTSTTSSAFAVVSNAPSPLGMTPGLMVPPNSMARFPPGALTRSNVAPSVSSMGLSYLMSPTSETGLAINTGGMAPSVAPSSAVSRIKPSRLGLSRHPTDGSFRTFWTSKTGRSPDNKGSPSGSSVTARPDSYILPDIGTSNVSTRRREGRRSQRLKTTSVLRIVNADNDGVPPSPLPQYHPPSAWVGRRDSEPSTDIYIELEPGTPRHSRSAENKSPPSPPPSRWPSVSGAWREIRNG